MKPNRFREVLNAGGTPVGHMIMEFGTRGIAKILEAADVDFVLYDMEHSGFDIERIFDLIAWSKACPFAPFVRVPYRDYHFLARVMDAGASREYCQRCEVLSAGPPWRRVGYRSQRLCDAGPGHVLQRDQRERCCDLPD